jgi:hypothetical protein
MLARFAREGVPLAGGYDGKPRRAAQRAAPAPRALAQPDFILLLFYQALQLGQEAVGNKGDQNEQVSARESL